MATAIPHSLHAPNLTASVASGEALDVRAFRVEEGVSRLFSVSLEVVSTNADLDFEACVGGAATFEIHHRSARTGESRFWSGVCELLEQSAVEEEGLSTYELRIVPSLWLTSQRRNYRVFQDQSELEVVLAVLGEWGIAPRLQLDPASYPRRRYRAQYAETDFAFVSRLLEDIGVTYHFEQSGRETRLVLVDAPNRHEAWATIPFVATPNERIRQEYVTRYRTMRQVRPGRFTQSDVDYRRPLDYPLSASASGGTGIERRLERYHHDYGSFLWKGVGVGTPIADDRGAARTDEAAARSQVRRRLEAERVEGRAASFETTAYDLSPGRVVEIAGHARGEVGEPQLIVACTLSGTATGAWLHHCETRFTDVDHRPALSTPRPRTLGVESATVTGPPGEEIHTDELGRVRVHFHWDREGLADHTSSCWIPVSQPWAGAGFGAISLPRVGQEVLVDFLGEDPDRPIVLGGVFTATTPPPYELPKNKSVSGMRSESYPRPKSKAPARLGGGPADLEAAAVAGGPTAPSGPLGGGPSSSSLGGTIDAPTPEMEALRRNMPGVFGGSQAPQDELTAATSNVLADGPDGQDVTRSANGLVTDDTAGAETICLQGQRDLRVAVKNNLVCSVGANRVFSILGNDSEDVAGHQSISVGQDRTVEVGGLQCERVQLDILGETQGSRRVQTEIDFVSHSLDGSLAFFSHAGHALMVGASSILMSQTSIVIDSPKVYINPGKAIIDAVLAGQNLEDVLAAEAREARIAKAMEAIAAHEMESRFGAEIEEGSLRATARGAPTPFTDAVRRAGVTDPGEIREAAQRMAEIMYGPP